MSRFHHHEEVADYQQAGYDLALVTPCCRVYRGNNEIVIEGAPATDDEQAEVSRAKFLIEELGGHLKEASNG